MITKENEQQKPLAKKKQWVTPLVEIINSDNIASGSVFANNEGGYIKSYVGGVLAHATYFS